MKSIQNFIAIKAPAVITFLLLLVTALGTSSSLVHGQNLPAVGGNTTALVVNMTSYTPLSLANITVKKDQVFNVTIAGSMPVGDDWNATFDKNIFQLLSTDYEPLPGTPAAAGAPGGEGNFFFTFKAMINDFTSPIKFYNNFRGVPFAKQSAEQSGVQGEKILTVKIM